MGILDIILYVLIGVLVIGLVVCLAIANYAGSNLVAIFERYEKLNAEFFNTLTLAKNISSGEFNNKIVVNVIDGFLTDYYHAGSINLSSRVAFGSNVSAFSVCAHELGHAMQYRDTPEKMRKFAKKLKLSAFLSNLTLPLLLIGVICIIFNIIAALVLCGLSFLTFFIGLLTKLSTIKIEKEASLNGLKLLQKYADFDNEKLKYAKKVLSAAKLTYIALFLKSVLKWTMLVNKYDFY